MLTLDQAFAHLEGLLSMRRLSAADCRRNGDEYKAAANDADDVDLRRRQFDESSRFYGYAREIDRDVEALDIVLRVAKQAAPKWDGRYEGYVPPDERRPIDASEPHMRGVADE